VSESLFNIVEPVSENKYEYKINEIVLGNKTLDRLPFS
jgi:hypothetical protein